MSRCRNANGWAEPFTTRESIIEVIANTTPQQIPIQCRIPRLRLTTLPASCRVGRILGLKTVGASTKAKKMSPPIQITSDNNMTNRTKDMAASEHGLSTRPPLQLHHGGKDRSLVKHASVTEAPLRMLSHAGGLWRRSGISAAQCPIGQVRRPFRFPTGKGTI